MHLVLILFAIVIYLSFQIIKKGEDAALRKNEYYILVVLLISAIGFRGEGIDNDYASYVASIYAFQGISEPTFLILAWVIRTLSLPVSLLFVVYAYIGVYYKMRTIFYYSPLPYVSIIIYLSNIALLQDITQIRAGAATAIFLTSIPYLFKGEKVKFILLIFLAGLFHFSALPYLVLLFIGGKDFSKRSYFLWMILPVLGYLFYFFIGGDTLVDKIPLPQIKDKLLMYKSLEENNVEGFAELNLFNPYMLFKISIYYFLLYHYSTLKKYNNKFTLYLKIFAISLFVFPVLGAVTPIMGYRVGDMFSSIEILLFPYIFILFKGRKQRVAMIVGYFILLFSVNIFYKHLIYI